MKALPDMVARWLPAPYVSLGTDGFGRSGTREDLRALFEIDPPHIAAATLVVAGALRRDGPGQGGQGDPRARHRPRQDRPARPLRPPADGSRRRLAVGERAGPGCARRALPATGADRLRRAGGARRADARRVRPAPRLARRRGLRRPARRGQPDPRVRPRPSSRCTSAIAGPAGPGWSSPASRSCCRRSLIVAVLAWLYVEHGTAPGGRGAARRGRAGRRGDRRPRRAGRSAGRAIRDAGRTSCSLAGASSRSSSGVPEIAVLLGLGVRRVGRGPSRSDRRVGASVGPAHRPAASRRLAARRAGRLAPPASPAIAAVAAPLADLPRRSLKIGAVLFGSGYVLVALLRSELVEGLGWITEAQLIDAVAVGQATPGPAVLDGDVHRLPGRRSGRRGRGDASASSCPRSSRSAVSIPLLDRLRGSVRARAFLDGVNAAAVGLLAVVAVQLGRRRDPRPRSALVDAVVALRAAARAASGPAGSSRRRPPSGSSGWLLAPG